MLFQGQGMNKIPLQSTQFSKEKNNPNPSGTSQPPFLHPWVSSEIQLAQTVWDCSSAQCQAVMPLTPR